MSFSTPAFSVRLLRHATLLVTTPDATILVDPMLSPKDALDPVGNAGNDRRIPMVDLPISDTELATLVKEVDMILVTHTHRDHWDGAAQKMIDKSKPIFCQPADLGKIKSLGFVHVLAIEDSAGYNDCTIHRTGGQHGTGEIGEKMGVVSGFVIKQDENALYIAGDTIWCSDVSYALKQFKPQTVVVNAGGAEFLAGGPITMNEQDVMTVANAVPSAKIVAVHMDTVNHCKVTRDILKKFVAEKNLKNVVIPADGETLTF